MSDQTAPAAGGRHRPRAHLAAPPSGRESVDRLALRGDEAEPFRRYGGWLMRVTRCPLGCSVALAEDACAHASLQLCRTQPPRTDSLPSWLVVPIGSLGRCSRWDG